MKTIFRRMLCALLIMSLYLMPALAEVTITITDPDGQEVSLEIFETEPEPTEETENEPAQTVDDNTARTAFIDGIISLAQQKYEETGGRARRAHYKSDIFLCKTSPSTSSRKTPPTSAWRNFRT